MHIIEHELSTQGWQATPLLKELLSMAEQKEGMWELVKDCYSRVCINASAVAGLAQHAITCSGGCAWFGADIHGGG